MEIFRLFGSVLLKGGDETEKQLDSIDKKGQLTGLSLEKLGGKLLKAGAVVSVGLTVPLVALGKGMLEIGMAAVESENLFSVSLGMMADKGRKWSENLRDTLGLNEYELRKNVGSMDAMLKSMGLGETAAYDMASGLTQLSYDMASFYNLKPEEAFAKLQAGISGEAEPLKRLGILINDTTIETYAMTKGIVAQGEEMTEQQKVLARFGVIMEQTKLAQGDLARTIDSPTNRLRIQQEQWKQIQVDLGMKIIPIFSKVLGVVNDVTGFLGRLTEKQLDFIVKTGLVAAGVGPLITIIGGLTSAVGFLSAAFAFLAANPVVLVLAAVAAAVGGIIFLVNRANSTIDEMSKGLVEAIELDRDASLKASEEKYQALYNTKQKELEMAVNASNKSIELLDKEYEAAVDGAEKKEKALIAGIQKRKEAADKEYNDNIARIRDEYGVFEEKTNSKTDIAREGYDKEVEFATDAYNEKIALLDAEYAAQLRNIDAEKNEKIRALQDQIFAIDTKTKEENRLIREQKDIEKQLALEAKIAAATDAEERRALQNELQAFLIGIAREKILEQREAEKSALAEKIEEEKKAAETKKEVAKTELEKQKELLEASLNNEKEILKKKLDENIRVIQEERVKKEEAEKAKYEAAKAALDKESEAMDGWLENYKVKLAEEVEAKKKAESEKLQAVKDRMAEEQMIIQLQAEEEKKRIAEEAARKAEEARKKVADGLTFADKYLPALKDGRLLPGLPTFDEMFPDMYSDIPGMATGGNVQRSGAAIIGENGPELLDFPRGARVTPLDKASGGVVVNLYYPTLLNRQAIEEIGEQLVSVIRTNTGLRTV